VTLIPFLVEQVGRTEGAYDINSRLLKESIIFIGTEIKDDVATFSGLEIHDLVDILTKPKDAIIKQFQKLLETEGVEGVFTEDALTAIGRKSLERKIGAPGQKSFIEDLRLDMMFYLPTTKKTTKIKITKRMVEVNELSFERLKQAIGV